MFLLKNKEESGRDTKKIIVASKSFQEIFVDELMATTTTRLSFFAISTSCIILVLLCSMYVLSANIAAHRASGATKV